MGIPAFFLSKMEMIMRSVGVLLFYVLLTSCSQVNTQSNDYYKNQKKMRHGIVPIPNSKTMTKEIISPPPKEKVAKGKELYLKNCYSCHGADGKGNGPGSIDLKVKPKNLIKIVKEVPNFKLYMSISQWQGKMPGWINVLSQNELDDVKAYIKSLALRSSPTKIN